MANLHIASLQGDLESVRILLKEGANPYEEIADLQFETSMIRDFCENNDQDLESLTHFPMPMSPLSLAARNGHSDVLKEMLDHLKMENFHHDPSQLCKCIKCDCGPLHMSMLGGWSDCVDLLIQYGWDVNQKDWVQWTPIQLAAYKGHIALVKHIIKNYSINKDEYYAHAILLAAENDHCHVCQTLIEECNHKSCGLVEEALMVACEHHNIATIETLAKRKEFQCCTKQIQTYYDISGKDSNNIGKASEVFQILADQGAPLPNLKEVSITSVQPSSTIEPLTYAAWRSYLKNQNNITKTEKSYLKNIVNPRKHYHCNSCQKVLPGIPFSRRQIGFLHPEQEQPIPCTFSFCSTCARERVSEVEALDSS